MTAFDVYKKYIAITTHFKGTYDYFKYNGTVNIKQTTFLKRKDRYFFEKISRNLGELDIAGFILANTVHHRGKYWISSFDNAMKVFLEWKRITEGLPHYFSNECDNIVAELNDNERSFDDLFTNTSGVPLIIRLLMNDIISNETVILLDYLLGFLDRLHKVNKDDPVWCEYYQSLKKYKPFIVISDLSKYKTIIQSKLDNIDNKPYEKT